MYKLADLIESHVDELAELETLDNGKPISESRHADLPLVIDCLRYYAGWADKIHGQTIPIRGHYHCYTRRSRWGGPGKDHPWNPHADGRLKWGPAAWRPRVHCRHEAGRADPALSPHGAASTAPGGISGKA